MTADPESGQEEKQTLKRRNYMKLTGALAGGSVLGATQIGQVSGKTHHGISFENVVDAVADLGCDPNGNQDVTSKVESALDGKTVVEFPSGTYHWEGSITTSTDRIGLRGKSDDVRFTFPSGYNEFFVNTTCDQALFENFDVDVRPEQTATGIRINADHGFHAENIEHIGRAVVDSSDVTRCWQLRVNDPNSTGVLKNFVAKKGSAWAHYKSGDGRAGISVYGGKGTVKIIDCHLEEFGNNGIYGSRTLSAVQVIGGTYRNNNVCGVRVSGKGSYVDGATIEVDPKKYSGPHTLEDDAFTMRGVVFEQGNAGTGGTFDEAGGEIRNTKITIQKHSNAGPAIGVWTGGRTLSVKNTKIVYNNGGPAIHREKQVPQGRHDPSPAPRWLRLNRVEITGSASGGPTILAGDASGSRIQNSYINQTGSGRDGVVFSNSKNTLVKNTTIDVSGKAVRLKSSSGKSIKVSKSGDPLSLDVGNTPKTAKSQPSLVQSTASVLTGDKSTKGDKDKKSNNNVHTIDIKGGGSKAQYTFAVDGTIESNEDLGSFECTDDTFMGKNWASGSVLSSKDKFKFTGSITSFSVDEGTTVRVDGKKVDPKTLGTKNETHTIVIDGSASKAPATYSLSVDGTLEEGKHTDRGDRVSRSTASGSVADGRDSYRFSGQITEFDADGDVTITFGRK